MSSSVYYGLNLNTRNLTGDLYLNIFFSGLVEIPALFFVVLVHNKLGRRLTVSILMTVTGVFCFLILVLDIIGKYNHIMCNMGKRPLYLMRTAKDQISMTIRAF